MARLDRLSTVKEVAQLGAMLGREFTYELLQAVSPLDEATLQRDLARLVEAELLYQRGFPPQARYIFKHALIQETAYQSLLRSTRQQYHRQIAQTLAEQFRETAETQPELLAHHYTEAGLFAQAIPYWQQAGQRAIERSAHAEAISHLTKGLELLKTSPQTPERSQQELTLQIALGAPLMATKGYAAPEVEKVYARARELCHQVGETPQLFRVLLGLFAFYLVRAEFRTAHELGEQLLRLAQNGHNPARLLGAYQALGLASFYLGEFVSARKHLEQGVALYDPQKHSSHALRSGQDPGVTCLCHMPWVLWYLGYPDQALQKSLEALALAQELSHPFSQVYALNYAAGLHQFRREWQATHERTETLIALSREQGFGQWVPQATILQGWILAEQGQEKQGIAQMSQGLTAWRATGAEIGSSWFLALLAETYGKAGQGEEGLAVLAEALSMVNKTGERFYEAELYRLKGQLTLQKFQVSGSKFQVPPNPQHLTPSPQAEAEAETYFQKAIEIARQQQAKALELRAVMSLSQLWQSQGKKAEAQQMLTEIVHWFSEGFDTPDLQGAKALLQELA
jgi:predicted ATPase